ncbi:MAG: EamA family transporter [Gammaproteobacteria bacterium]|nr:EamA family transporter [Gammaproteobacteria bacterium]
MWGSTWYAILFQLGVVHPILSVAYRYVIAAALLIGFCLARRKTLRFSPRDHLGIAAQGAFLFSLNYVLFYIAASHLTSGLLALTFSTIVLMNMLNGAWLFRFPVSGQVLAGAGLGLSGITLVFWPELTAFEASRETLFAIGLAIFATYLASLGNMGSVYTQRRRLPVVQTNALGMAYGAVITLAVAAGAAAAGQLEFAFDASFPYVASLLYLAVFGSVLAFGAYLTLLGRIGADRAAYATVLFPLVALTISTVFEGYRWSAPAMAGTVLILVGNGLVLKARRVVKKPPAPP